MGGSGGSAPDVSADTGQLQQELNSLRDPNSQEAQRIQGLIGGQVSDEQALAQRQALSAVNQGTQAAVQGARQEAAGRGLFSSDIGLGLEIGAQQQLAGQRAGVFQQRSQEVQQDVLSGLQASQQRTGLRGQLAGQISQLRTGANQQQASMDFQQQQRNQQQAGQFAQGAGKLALGFATGGASLAATGF